jgi:hypothetical protein
MNAVIDSALQQPNDPAAYMHVPREIAPDHGSQSNHTSPHLPIQIRSSLSPIHISYHFRS